MLYKMEILLRILDGQIESDTKNNLLSEADIYERDMEVADTIETVVEGELVNVLDEDVII